MGRAGGELTPALGGPFAVCGGCTREARRKRKRDHNSSMGCRNFHNSRTVFAETLQVLSSSPCERRFSFVKLSALRG
jgi:hypothetical protein